MPVKVARSAVSNAQLFTKAKPSASLRHASKDTLYSPCQERGQEKTPNSIPARTRHDSKVLTFVLLFMIVLRLRMKLSADVRLITAQAVNVMLCAAKCSLQPLGWIGVKVFDAAIQR